MIRVTIYAQCDVCGRKVQQELRRNLSDDTKWDSFNALDNWYHGTKIGDMCPQCFEKEYARDD